MKAKHQRLAFLLFSMSCMAVAAFFILGAFKENLVFFYSPTDLKAHDIPPDRTIRIGGLVASGSVTQDDTNQAVSFTITDNNTTVEVHYKGLLPNLFREGQGVVADGKLQADGAFIASNILAKHDENYMPPEVAKAIKESGHWKEPHER